MSFLGAALGGAAAGLLGGIGQKTPKIKFTPPNFDAGGLTGTFSNGSYGVNASDARAATVGGIADTFTQQAGDYGDLRSKVAPGTSALRDAVLANLANKKSQAIGNLRDNLARRRVLGSSFGQDSIMRADKEYSQAESEVIAKTFLQEIEASSKLIDAQYGAARGALQTGLSEMNLEAGLASDLAGKASASMNNIAMAQAKLDAEAAAGAGKFFGQLGSTFGGGLFSKANTSFGDTYLGKFLA